MLKLWMEMDGDGWRWMEIDDTDKVYIICVEVCVLEFIVRYNISFFLNCNHNWLSSIIIHYYRAIFNIIQL